MKRTSKRLISFILTLTLICTMLAGFGAIETFAAEGTKLVKRNVHLDINEIGGWVNHNSTYMPYVNDKPNVKNASLHVKKASLSTDDTDDEKMLKITGGSGFGYIDIYYDKDAWAKTATTGIFKITCEMMADWETGSGSPWEILSDASTKIPSYALRDEFAKTVQNHWYDFQIEFNMDEDYLDMKMVDKTDPTAADIKLHDDKYTGGFYKLRMYFDTFTSGTKSIYMKKLNVSYYETKNASGSFFTKSVINEIGSDNYAAPESTLSFTLDKAIEGLENNPEYVTVTDGENTLTPISVALSSGSTYTATFENKLAESTNYTLNISAECYAGYLEVSDSGYIDVIGISKAFQTTVDNPEAYLQQLASGYGWELISSLPSYRVDTALELPSSYNGVDVTWTAEPETALSGNTLVLPESGTQTVTLQPKFSYSGATHNPAQINITLVNYDGSGKLNFINPDTTRSTTDGGKNKLPYDNGVWVTASNNDWNGYFQVDFAGYEEILEDPTTKLTFSVSLCGYTGSATLAAYGVAFYALDDKTDVYADNPDINGVDAAKLGLHDVKAEQLVAQRVDTTMVKDANGVTYSQEITSDGRQAILNAMKSGTDNSIVTFTMKSSGGQSYITSNHENSFIGIEYTLDKVDNQAYLDKVAESLKWDVISDEDKTGVTENLYMPTFYKGATVVWNSTNTDAIESDGTIHPARNEAKKTTLSASLGYLTATPVPLSFDEITVAPEKLRTTRVDLAQLKQTDVSRASTPIDNYNTTQHRFYVFYMASEGLDAAGGESGRGDELVYMQWDLKDYAQMIAKAESIEIKITRDHPTNSANNAKGNTGLVTVLNDSYDNWNENLTYNMARDAGMYTDPGLATVKEVDFASEAVITIGSEDFTQGIKDAFAQNPDQGLVSFRLNSSDNNACQFYYNPSDKPVIEISYYATDLEDDTVWKETMADQMPWSAVTTQDEDNVVADLELPATWYGQAVAWKSNNTAITDAGVVTPQATETTGTLVATVDGKTNTFTVTVPAADVALKSARTYTSNIANYNYTTGHIYANAAVGPCTAIIATYDANGALAAVTVKDIESLTKGEKIVISDSHKTFADARTKIILVNNMTDLEPLAAAR